MVAPREEPKLIPTLLSEKLLFSKQFLATKMAITTDLSRCLYLESEFIIVFKKIISLSENLETQYSFLVASNF